MMGISTLQDAIKLSGVIDLVPYLRTAVFAPIFIPVAVRKDQKKELIDRNRTPTVGARVQWHPVPGNDPGAPWPSGQGDVQSYTGCFSLRKPWI